MQNRTITSLLLISVISFAGCVDGGRVLGKSLQTTGSEVGVITLNGAGATFPYPLISKWSYEYNRRNPEVQINYQSIGSGGGIKQTMEKTVSWGASDAPLKETEFAKMPGILHIPETIGAVVVSYNLPGMGKSLRLSGEVVADIFLGRITKWNDPKIAELNPDVFLPDRDILVVHRSDGSGTTYVFTDYLSSVSGYWRINVGKGKSMNWPVGLGGKGNEGVAGLIQQNPYSIGYLELAYAARTKMAYASIKNLEGNFVEPTLENIAAAAAAASLKMPGGDESWSKVSMVNPPGKNSYPLSSFTYLLVYNDLSVIPGMDERRAKALVEFLDWIIHDGQKYSANLLYVPLPEKIVRINENTIGLINYGGKPLNR
jgi:phosphate ABC transporter phosphate-binding protein